MRIARLLCLTLVGLLMAGAAATAQVQSLAQMQPAVPISDTDTFFWCQWPQNPGTGCDNNPRHPLVRGTAAQLFDYIASKGGVSGGGTPGGSSGQVQWNNGGAFGGFTMNGSCTLTTSSGVIACPLMGNPIETWTRSGNTTQIVTLSGPTPNGNMLVFDSSGNAVAGGVPPTGSTSISGMNTGEVAIAGSPGTIASSKPLSGGTGGVQVVSTTAAPKTVGHPAVWDANGNAIDNGPASGGGAGPQWTGTVTGINNYLSTPPSPQPAFTVASYNRFCGYFQSKNSAAATLNVGSTSPIAIQAQVGATAVPLVGGEIQVGMTCLTLNSGATAWLLDGHGGQLKRDPGSVTLTADDFAQGNTLVFTTATQAITLPPANTVTSNGYVDITVGPSANGITVTSVGSDGINTLAGPATVLLNTGTFTRLSTNGSGGANTWQVPDQPAQAFPLSWIPGQNLGSCATPPCAVAVKFFGSAQRLVSLTCAVGVPAGGTATFDFVFAPVGTPLTAIGSGAVRINTSSPGCDANGTPNSAIQPGLTNQDIPANSIVGLVVNQSWTTTNGNGLAEIVTSRK